MAGEDARVDWAAARGEKWRAHMGEMEKQIAPVDGPLIDALRLDAPLRVVDVGCGGGATSREVLRRAPAGSVVHGLDISPPMVDAARSASAPSEALRFELADAATAPPPAVGYHRLVSRFGIMFFSDPRAAFANLCSFLVPGGRFAFAVWADRDDNAWLGEVRGVVSSLVELAVEEPGGPGPFRYERGDDLVELLTDAGFIEVERAPFSFELAIGGGLGPAEAARFALSAFSDYRERLATSKDGAFAEAQRALTERFAPYLRGGEVRMPAKVHVVTGGRRG